MRRRIKLQPDLDELIKQLGGPAPPPLPRGQVLDSNKNIASTSLLGSSSIARGIRHVGTKRRLNRLCVRGKHLLQVSCGHHMETLFSRETPESLDVMVTQTGRPGVIFNGVADWVYEEEVICSVFVLILQSGMLL